MTSLALDEKGFVIIVLHAHLPFVRYPEHARHLEEQWFFEAVTETYIPLLGALTRLISDGIDFRITISLSPSLVEMFNDRLLRERCTAHIENLIRLAGKERALIGSDPSFGPLAEMYYQRFIETRRLYLEEYGADLTAQFRRLFGSGKIELITSSATHAFLPALMTEPAAVKTQLNVAAAFFRRNFGKDALGIWLPECGFAPGIDALALKAGFGYSVIENTGTGLSEGNLICSPVRTGAGFVLFPRDSISSTQVWCAEGGYPGDPDYRDFYRDIGYDRDFEHIKPYLPGETRTFTGIKYYRITGKKKEKMVYDRDAALRKALIHAGHFAGQRLEQLTALGKSAANPLVTAAYDAELFGHWWFEGPEWLEMSIRELARLPGIRLTTPSEYLSLQKDLKPADPPLSSWGEGGYGSTWIHSKNSWTYRHLHQGAELMRISAAKHRNASGRLKRALTQALRELLLAQSSDWTFMMKTGKATEFGKNKFEEHMTNFLSLHEGITTDDIDERLLITLEEKNCIFPELDFRIFIKE